MEQARRPPAIDLPRGEETGINARTRYLVTRGTLPIAPRCGAAGAPHARRTPPQSAGLAK